MSILLLLYYTFSMNMTFILYSINVPLWTHWFSLSSLFVSRDPKDFFL